MYRAYIKQQLTAPPEENVKQMESPQYEGVDPCIRDQVNSVWNVIEEQCKKERTEKQNAPKDVANHSKSDWKIVRVFVSSTFADFFNEREVLVKKVFPELREWCKSRSLKLIECDLRWGVPKDSSTARTILICLEEIDKCNDDNEGQPFFVTLLGNRYGWIPPITEVPREAKEDYEWIEGTSITCMEILHGAYRTKNPNAGFFMRNSSVYKDIPDSKRFRFVDDNPLSQHHVQVLREKIKTAFPTQIFDYEVSFKELSDASGKERVILTGYDDFASSVLDFLKSSISKTYPDQTCEEADPLQKDQEAQWLHVLDQATKLIGRKRERQILLDYLSTGTTDNFEKTADKECTSIRLKSEWDLGDDNQPLCVVEAPGGWGKTTLLCSLIKQALENGWKVFYHIVGSTSSSSHIEFLLKRLLIAINPDVSESELAVIEKGQLSNLKELLKKFLSEFRAKPYKLIILIDGVNELDNSATTGHLSWLPPVFPSNIKIVVSTKQHLPTLARLYEHSSLKMVLSTMTQIELSELAEQYLSIFSKKLDSKQLDSLMSQSKVDNPLWMTLMAEELRVFGDFSLIDKRISQFPPSLDELLIQIIDRLIAEDNEQGVVKKVLCLVACSAYGLPADNIRQICGDAKTKEEVPQLYWLQTQRVLQPYLCVGGFLGETIKFSHEAVEEAVYKHLLSSESDIRYWHTILADYYQYWCDNGRLKVFRLPRHLKRALLYKRLIDFMKNDKDSYHFMNPWERSNLLREARCRHPAEPAFPGSAPMMLCHSCAMGNRSFNVACTWSNQMCCVICSQLCHGANHVKAHACPMHANRCGKDMVKCVSCKSIINMKFKSGPRVPVPALLCSHCGFGIGDKGCAALDPPRFIS